MPVWWVHQSVQGAAYAGEVMKQKNSPMYGEIAKRGSIVVTLAVRKKSLL